MNFFLLSLNIFIVAGFLLLLSARFRKACGYIFLWSLIAACGIGLLSVINILYFGIIPSDFRLHWPISFGEFTIGIDSLSAFFLLLFFILALTAGIYGYGYLRDYTGRRSLGAHCFFYHLLVISIMLILVAKNAILFLIAWELMTIASYFLITFYGEKESVRKAGYIYLIATHTGTFCLWIMFLLMGSQSGSLNFDQMTAAPFSLQLAAIVFVLALIGFGVKAGFIPFHIWLPHAHPAAPSYISALLSGVVIKIGIYGFMRMIFLVKNFPSWCGALLLMIAAVCGVGGVLYALGQHEIKKLLAYHSIENIGIITLGLSMGLMGHAFHQDTVEIMGYTGALLHTFNHAIFKGLLFLSAGSVIRTTHTGEIDHMGGLLKILPWTGHLFLIGSLSICGLPFFNGFISEWLVYQSLLAGVFHFNIYGIIFSCLAVVSLALIGGLAALCFAKAFGTIFLGKNRSSEEHHYQESDLLLRGPMVILAAICIWIGLFPTIMVSFSLQAAQKMTGRPVPVMMEETILKPLLFAVGALSIVLIIFAVLALLRNFFSREKMNKARPFRPTETWSCGYAAPSSRMQYTASSFAEPILRIFKTIVVFKIKTVKPILLRLDKQTPVEASEELSSQRIFLRSKYKRPLFIAKQNKKYFPIDAQLSSQVLDASEYLFFRPMLDFIKKFLKKFNWIQSGHTQRYLLYIFFFLLILLIWKLR